jgi:RNA polymerase sigma-54 factor
MTLLGLTTLELRQRIEAELAANPALELLEGRRCPVCHRPLPDGGTCTLCSLHPGSVSERARPLSPDQPIVFLSHRDDFHRHSRPLSEDFPEDELASEIEDLPTFVLRQVATELQPEDRPLAAHVLTSLDEDGLLSVSLVEIARYHHVPLTRLESVLHLIQRVEPVGVGCSTPKEALLVQLDVLAETRPVPQLAVEAIRQGMDLLSRHRYVELGQLLGVSTAQAKELARYISDNLNPYPARAHWGDVHQNTEAPPDVYHFPDIVISQLYDNEDSPLVIEVLTPMAGNLRINPLFREALRQAPPDKADQWQADLDRATLLVKCLGQRNHTIVRMIERLATLQRDFILQGEAYLRPVTRARLAKELNVHESTISRAVADKALQLPSGRIIPLSMFFDRSLQVRTALKQLINQESGSVLSDSDLAELLKRQGYPVARRTVAKYRAMEGILPAHLRLH